MQFLKQPDFKYLCTKIFIPKWSANFWDRFFYKMTFTDQNSHDKWYSEFYAIASNKEEANHFFSLAIIKKKVISRFLGIWIWKNWGVTDWHIHRHTPSSWHATKGVIHKHRGQGREREGLANLMSMLLSWTTYIRIIK